MAGSESEKKKLILAVVLLVLAGLAIAWNFGVFSGGAATPTPTPAGAVDPSVAPPKGGGAREAK